jgi:hypothetical protein
MMSGIFGNFRHDFYHITCNWAVTDIKAFYDEFVDKPMCSDLCPCYYDDFVEGGWHTIPNSVLRTYSRQ